MIAPVPAPTQIIIIGPNATLGKLFNITKYGSETLLINLDHHNIIAIMHPITVPKENPIIVSYTVTFICSNKLFEEKFANVSTILLGLLVMKLSISPLLAPYSHKLKNNTNTNIWLPRINIFSVLIFFKYFFLSSL